MNECTVCRGKDLIPATLSPAQEACRNNVPDALPYQVCQRCGLWIQFPPPPFQYEADDEVDKRKESMTKERGHYEWLAERLYTSYKPSSVLDIGSNYPMLLDFMKNKHGVKEVLGIDGCNKTLEYAEELNVPVIHGNFMDHDFGDKKFDLITMVHVIEHFHSPLPAVMKLKKLLNPGPGGTVFIRTPLNDTEGLTRWHLTEFHFSVHPVIFGQRSLRTLFQTAGFEVALEAVGDGIGHGDFEFRKR
jgi:2-polyprenyl-3-methyl-5-hydroxy-6-metoxy-1,4-benzoquinol methylase